jgi:hypothetical protein
MRAVLPLRVTLLVLVLVIAVVVPGSALEPSLRGGIVSLPVAVGVGGGPLLSQAWSWFKALWPDAGCLLDPDGRRCATVAPAPRPDEGCMLDPNGKCAAGASRVAAPRPDAGCMIDPNGKCSAGASRVAAPRPDEGCQLDPDGRCRASAAPTPLGRKR